MAGSRHGAHLVPDRIGASRTPWGGGHGVPDRRARQRRPLEDHGRARRQDGAVQKEHARPKTRATAANKRSGATEGSKSFGRKEDAHDGNAATGGVAGEEILFCVHVCNG